MNQTYEVDINFIRQKADEIGDGESQYNFYRTILKYCEQFEKEGLTPKVFSDLEGGYVTTEEFLTRKFH